MKHERLKKWICLAFFLICLTPLAVFLLAGPAEAGANERLPAKPRLTAAGGLNLYVLTDTADYFAGRFGLRQELITANAALCAAVFGESAQEDVLLGTDGWLYYADTLADYCGSAPMTERQLWCAARNLRLMQEYAASRGAQFLFLCAPNKNTVYPEYMPARYARTEEASNLDRLEAALTEQGVAFCDVRQTLSSAQALTYYKTDSHWNGYGSALAHDAILEALGREGTLTQENFTMRAHSGDLYEMLYPASTRQEEGLALSRARDFRYDEGVHSAEDQKIHTFAATGGALLMFRDSFGNALHEDLAEDYGEALFSRAMPYDFSLMEKILPDTVIVELVERNLSWLCTRPPLLPAPERESPTAAVREETRAVTLTKEESSWDGLVCYRGTFAGFTPDADASVLAVLDGTCYEACPTDTGFQLLAPEAEKLTLYLSEDGALWRLQAE